MTQRVWRTPASILGICCLAVPLAAQERPARPDQRDDPPPARPGGGGRPPLSGPGGPMGQERKLVKQFDKDADGRLNKAERQAAREFLKKERIERGSTGGGPPRGFRFGRENAETPKPGPRVTPSEVKSYPDADLYEPTVLRTLFLEFEDDDWEAELADFYHTDVEVPATLTVDGKRYPNVGVHFRGSSSYFAVPPGGKRSLNVSLDFVDKKQRLHGSKTLNLLNSHEDASFLSSVLYSHIARKHIPAPKANLAKVVINGESWGVFANVQQFNKEFLAENYSMTNGTRWKVKGSPGGGGGLEYVGDDPENYKRRYQIKTKDDPEAWQALIRLCRTLNQTPPEKLEELLTPMLDIDNVLWFLALDVALINGDGYWIRASDYSLFLDDKGKFHIIPHDMNECFRPAMGPGMGGGFAMRGPGGPDGPGGRGGVVMPLPQPGEILPPFLQDTLNLTEEQKKQLATLQKEVDGKMERILTADQKSRLREMRGGPPGGSGNRQGRPGGPPSGGVGPRGAGGVDLDPLIGLDDDRKPLRSKLLAVPALRKKYLQYVKAIAEESLDWKKLGPLVSQYRTLIEKEVEADTRKLDSFADFQKATADAVVGDAGAPRRGPGMQMSLRSFADQRRRYLLDHAEIKKISP